jgi:hypothetical protein
VAVGSGVENRLRPVSSASRWAGGLLVTVLLAACAPSKVTVEQSPDLSKYRITDVVVMPFDALSTPQAIQGGPPTFLVPPGAKRSDINVTMPPPPGRLTPEVIVVPPRAAEKVTELFYEKLRARQGLKVRGPDETRRPMAEVAKESSDLSSEELARKVATTLRADAALTGRVLVWQPRSGSKWGGDPAAVGFEVKLISADGTVLWTGNYYERQRPMTEDFWGWLERRGVFVTSDELAEYGVTKLLKKFPVANAN